jgi:hypothetical protein
VVRPGDLRCSWSIARLLEISSYRCCGWCRWGVNESILEVAELFAAQGLRVLVPDLYKGKLGVDAEEASHVSSLRPCMHAYMHARAD